MDIQTLRDELRNYNPDPKAETERLWKQSVSGCLYARLQAKAVKENKEISLTGKLGLVESMTYDGQTVHLYKVFEGANAGEQDGHLRTYAEAWEYDHYSWWKEVLDQENLPVKFFAPCLGHIAKDAEIENWRNLIDPECVIKQFFGKDLKEEQISKLQLWIEEVLCNVFNRLLAPHFSVELQNGIIRLVGLESSAMKNYFENHLFRKQILDHFKNGLKEIEKAYRAKSQSV